MTELKNMKFIDLFCGIGGFHQALIKFGCKCVFACDINKDCREVYENNEWLIYQTELSYPLTNDVNYTPLCIKKGKLVGWGRNYYQSETKKYDVDINTN